MGFSGPGLRGAALLGAKGRGGRLFLEAPQRFGIHNVTWWVPPGRFGPWNGLWQRFSRLSRAGVFEAFSDLFADCSRMAHEVRMFDGTVVRPHVPAAGVKGGRGAWARPAKGRSPGRPSAGSSACPAHLHEIQLKTDLDGRTPAFEITGGEKANASMFERSRSSARTPHRAPAAPSRRSRSLPTPPARPSTSPAPSTAAGRIGEAAGKLKRLKRIALSCETIELKLASFAALATGSILV